MTVRTLSLTQRLTLMTVTFVVAVWAAASVWIWRMAEHDLNELLDAHLAQTAALLVAGGIDEEDKEDGGVLQAPILMHKYQSRVAFQIWDQGRLAARSADAPATPLASADSRGLSNSTINGVAWRVFTAARNKKGQGQEQDIIYVGEHVSARQDILFANLRAALVLVLALPLLVIGITWMVRRAVRPLRALGHGVARRQPRALDPLPVDGVLPEVRPLVDALNGLFGRVTEQLASEQRFTADAAHELRTPIAAIRVQAQVAQGATRQAERNVALDATIAGCDRMAHLIEQLLQLARVEADANSAGTAGEPGYADLAAVAADCVRQMLPQASERGQQIDWQIPAQPVPALMNATLAAVLLRNLLDNALRYSPGGARVRVRLAPAAAGEGACLTVEDSGPGLPPEALARLGERFFRQLGTGQSGSGLGWSIVHSVARLHGLRIETDRSPALGGLRVRVTWPDEVQKLVHSLK